MALKIHSFSFEEIDSSLLKKVLKNVIVPLLNEKKQSSAPKKTLSSKSYYESISLGANSLSYVKG